MYTTEEHGATKEEAINASLAIQRLMKKYKIEEIDLTGLGKEKEIADRLVDVSNYNWVFALGKTIGDNFCCKAFKNNVYDVKAGKFKYKLDFYGYDIDVQVCIKTFNMLVKVIKKGITKQKALSKELYGTSKGVQNAYAFSFIDAVSDSLSEQCKALQLVMDKEVENKFAIDFPKVVTKNHKIDMNSVESLRRASQQGYKDGKEASEIKKLK